MPTVEVRISNGLDDVVVYDSAFEDDQDYVTLGDAFGDVYKNALMFRNVTVPQGATITAAYIILKEYSVASGTVVRVKIIGNDVDNAVSPTSEAEFNALVETTEKVDWDNLVAQDGVGTTNTPSMVPIVQEIVDRPSFNDGDMQFMINDDGSDTNAYRDYESYESEPTEAALLHIEYGVASPSDPVARVSSIRHIFRPGLFRMQNALGDLGFDIDVAEAVVRKLATTAVETGKLPKPSPVTITCPSGSHVAYDNWDVDKQHPYCVEDV